MNTKRPDPEMINLAGPCGFYCGTCRHYLARVKGKLAEKNLKAGCEGCRIRDKNCAFIKKKCALIRKREIDFCFECDDYPCKHLKKIHNRHVLDDDIHMIDNLVRIREVGPEQWLKEQEELWSCPKCGGKVCVMDRECYDCGYRPT